jgi:hypothetical protein
MAECHLLAISMRLERVCVCVWTMGLLHLGALFGRDVWNRRVLEDTTVEELHDVKVGADDLFILAETESFWYRDVGVLEGVDNAVLAVYFVCGLRRRQGHAS